MQIHVAFQAKQLSIFRTVIISFLFSAVITKNKGRVPCFHSSTFFHLELDLILKGVLPFIFKFIAMGVLSDFLLSFGHINSIIAFRESLDILELRSPGFMDWQHLGDSNFKHHNFPNILTLRCGADLERSSLKDDLVG
jgi:hypothetical protein